MTGGAARRFCWFTLWSGCHKQAACSRSTQNPLPPETNTSASHNSQHISHTKAVSTLPMLRLLSPKAQGCKEFCKPSNPCHVGIHWKALTEYSQMSTHVPWFQSFYSGILHISCNGQIGHQQHKG